MTATTGTKASIWANVAVGLFAVLDQSGIINLVPPQYGMWATLAMTLANAGLHAMTGNAPVVGGK